MSYQINNLVFLYFVIYVKVIPFILSESPLNKCEQQKPYRKPDSTCASLQEICERDNSKPNSVIEEIKSQLNLTNQLCTSTFLNFRNKEKLMLEDSYKNFTALLKIIGQASLLTNLTNQTYKLNDIGLKIEKKSENSFNFIKPRIVAIIVLLFVVILILLESRIQIIRRIIQHFKVKKNKKLIDSNMDENGRLIESERMTALKDSNLRLADDIHALQSLIPLIKSQSTSIDEMNTTLKDVKEQQTANKESLSALGKRFENQEKLANDMKTANSQITEQSEIIKTQSTSFAEMNNTLKDVKEQQTANKESLIALGNRFENQEKLADDTKKYLASILQIIEQLKEQYEIIKINFNQVPICETSRGNEKETGRLPPPN